MRNNSNMGRIETMGKVKFYNLHKIGKNRKNYQQKSGKIGTFI